MCTLLLFHKVFKNAPLTLLSNRDEMNDRPFSPPALLSDMPRVFGPKDDAAGGTWLGINEWGLLVALTNHYGTLTMNRASSLCSRGYVVSEALRHKTAREAAKLVELLSPACKYFTILAADINEAIVVDHAGPEGALTYNLEPGHHVVTNSRFLDPQDKKAERALAAMKTAAGKGPPGIETCRALLGDHQKEPGQLSPLCIHPKQDSKFQTVSSSVIELGPGGKTQKFLFAPGPPCVTEFREYFPGL